MNSDQLSLFLHVANTGNLSRVARETGISQSALSRKIAGLERELGTRLFHRSGRGVLLTESGRRLESYATDISMRLETATREMSNAVRQGPSNIIIGAPPTIARMIFVILGKSLMTSYPGINIHFKEGLGGDLQQWLAEGEVDAAIVYLPLLRPSLKVDLLLKDTMHLIAPMDFKHAGGPFPVKQLSEVPLILPSWPNGLRMLLDALMGKYSGKLNVSMQCDASVDITKQLVMQGCGCTILSKMSVQEEVAKCLLQAIPLANPDVFREVAVVIPHNRPPILHQRRLIASLRSLVLSLVETGQWEGASIVR